MKKLRNVFLSVVAIVLIGLNLKIVNENVDSNEISLKNIETMQASAGEMYCDQQTNIRCVITVNGVAGVSIGHLVSTN